MEVASHASNAKADVVLDTAPVENTPVLGADDVCEKIPELAEFVTAAGLAPSSTAGTPPNRLVQAARTLFLHGIEPTLAFRVFCELVLRVSKTSIGGAEDPTHALLDLAVVKASSQFWKATRHPDNKEALASLVARCRTWIGVSARRQAFEPVLAALKVLHLLDVPTEQFEQFGLLANLTPLETQTADSEVARFAQELATKYDKHDTSKSDGPLRLRIHKRAREATTCEASPSSSNAQPYSDGEGGTKEDNPRLNGDSRDTWGETRVKRAKTDKHVHWKADKDLVSVRFFTMEGVAKFKSSKNAKFQDADEASAMHPDLEWSTPKLIDFTAFLVANASTQHMCSTKRGGGKEPDSQEAIVQESREAESPRVLFPDLANATVDTPADPAIEETKPEPGSMPRDGGKFSPKSPSAEWLKKQGKSPAPPTPQQTPLPGMPIMSPMMPPMMPPMMNPLMSPMMWGMNPMGMTPAQMAEFMKMNNMFKKQG